MKLSVGQQVLVWEPGKGILRTGRIHRIDDQEYVTLEYKSEYKGPYHAAFIFPDTTPVRNFIKQVEDMKKAMRLSHRARTLLARLDHELKEYGLD